LRERKKVSEELFWEGIKGRALVLKGKLIIQTLSKENSRLGELNPKFYDYCGICMMYDIRFLACFRIKSNFWVSRIFPEIAWRTMNCRQTTHEILCCFWVPREEPSGGMTLGTRRRMNATQFLGFPLNGLTMVLNPPSDTSLFGSISMFLGFWNEVK